MSQIWVMIFWANHQAYFDQTRTRFSRCIEIKGRFDHLEHDVKLNHGVCIGLNFRDDGTLYSSFMSHGWYGYNQNQTWQSYAKASSIEHALDFSILTNVYTSPKACIAATNKFYTSLEDMCSMYDKWMAGVPLRRRTHKTNGVFSLPSPLP